jgi:hypothetical protein
MNCIELELETELRPHATHQYVVWLFQAQLGILARS